MSGRVGEQVGGWGLLPPRLERSSRAAGGVGPVAAAQAGEKSAGGLAQGKSRLATAVGKAPEGGMEMDSHFVPGTARLGGVLRRKLPRFRAESWPRRQPVWMLLHPSLLDLI
jgi:hypothetical protein